MDTSLQEIWDGESAEKVRNQHRKPETLSIKACQQCYGPYQFVETVANNFIHYLYLKIPGLSNDEMGHAVTNLFKGMDEAMKTKNISAIKAQLVDAFQSIDRGNPVLSQISSEIGAAR